MHCWFLPLARRRIETAQAQDGQYLRPSDPAYFVGEKHESFYKLYCCYYYTFLWSLIMLFLVFPFNESPKGANVASTFQRKLAVECIFCSACIRFVECCPQEGLTEKLWIGLENFVFDWLINADRDFCMEGMIHYWSQLDSMDMEVDLQTRILPPQPVKIAGKFASALMAIYIGGAINYVAVSEALGVSPSVVAARLNLCLGLMNKYQLELEPQLEALVGRKPWSKFMNADNQYLAIDFLDKLLCYDHQDRLTAKEAMQRTAGCGHRKYEKNNAWEISGYFRQTIVRGKSVGISVGNPWEPVSHEVFSLVTISVGNP
ncbi:hypothetical protein LXL04_022199 [Taraxacum kok-saghyz]